jgi:hypothetical protein
MRAIYALAAALPFTNLAFGARFFVVLARLTDLVLRRLLAFFRFRVAERVLPPFKSI